MFAIERVLAVLVLLVATVNAGADYSMYVWTDSFDSTVSSCGESQFLAWDTSDTTCFTHSWNTAEKRTWLWNTCNVQGREVSRIYLSGVHTATQGAYDNTDCSFSGISFLRETIAEGHSQVADLKIYALFADSDIAVSEKDKVKYIVYYNDNCAATSSEKFDGVAVNNEAYGPIKCSPDGSDADRTAYLDKLQTIKTEALKQATGTLRTHYSIGWHWGTCSSTTYEFTWDGTLQRVSYHMIDIFDSVDVQVGFILIDAIKTRMETTGLAYSQSLGKEVYATLYLNKVDLCQTSFFPMTCGAEYGPHTEDGMMAVFDTFSSNSIGYAKPCIHYFRGVYSSGGNSDWPVHNPPATTETTTPKSSSTDTTVSSRVICIALIITMFLF